MHRLQNRTELCYECFPTQLTCFGSRLILVSGLNCCRKDSSLKSNLPIERNLSGALFQDTIQLTVQDAVTRQLLAVASLVRLVLL